MTNLPHSDSRHVNRTYLYRLYPSRAQERVLFAWFWRCCEIYNAALQERQEAWRKQRVSISRIDQEKQVPVIRAERHEFESIPVAVLRGVLRRLDRAFTAFFRRCKSGEKPGFPRYRAARRWRTIEIDDLKKNPIVSGGKRVQIPLMGLVKFKQHRPLEGRPKVMRIVLKNGRWYVAITCTGVAPKPLPATGKFVGVAVGLTHFAVTSDGQFFENPRPLDSARLCLERAQRRVTRRKNLKSQRRRRAACLLARHHERVANIRRENCIRVARALVQQFDRIIVEDINIPALLRDHPERARAILDAGWATFIYWLYVKAESAGREVTKVNPAWTSCTCSECGWRGPRLPLTTRMFVCGSCGFSCDRDLNAARNILRLGTSPRGAAHQRRSAKSAANGGPGHARPLVTRIARSGS